MGTVGDLIAKLFCDSTDFDKNIKKSQKEVQEFKRKTEREAAAVNNSFNKMGSAVAKINPGLGNIIGSLGKVAPLAAAGTVAFGLFKQVVQQSETAMDNLEKKTSQLSGAWEHITTTISNGNIFSGMTSSLQEAVRLAGELAEIMDNLGTLSGYRNLDKTEAETNLSELKEMIKAGASKEDIAKQVEKTKASIARFDKDSGNMVSDLKAAYDDLLESFYNDIKGGGHVGLQSGKHFIEKFATNTGWRTSIESWKTYFDENVKNIFGKYTKLDSLKTNKIFEKFLKDTKLYDSYLFNDFKRGGSEGKKYIDDIISIITGVISKKEDSKYGIENIQKTRSAWLDIKRESSEMHTSLYKRMGEYLNKKPEKAGGGRGRGRGVYTSKQEAPKERTLQDILYDLDKNLDWNKYSAQNLGKDITELNLSSLERTASELEDLLKNTTDEEQRKQILSVLKTINNVINKPKETKKPNKSEYKDLYEKDLGDFVLNSYSKNNLNIPEFLNKLKEKFLNGIPKDAYSNLTGGLVTNNEVFSPETAEKFNYNADSFIDSKQVKLSNSSILRSLIQSIFDVYKGAISLDAATLKKALDTKSSSNYKYISSPLFGDLRKLDIPIKYPEKFYYENPASSKFSSGVLSIIKKYAGFDDNFRKEFAKNAYSEFDRLIGEDSIIRPGDVNEILYQVYLDTIKKYSGNVPDLFKNSEEFTRFINDRSKIEDHNLSDKLRIKLDTKHIVTLFLNSILDNIDTKEAAASLNNNLVNINSEYKKIKAIGYDQSAVIDIINKLSENDVNVKANLINKVKEALADRKKTIIDYINKFNTSKDSIKLENTSNNLKLIQLEKEKRLNNGILSEDKLSEYEELKKETNNDFSGFTDKQLETFEETSKTEEEKLRKAIEEGNKIKEDLINELNQTDEIAERLQKEEEENDVLRERQKELSEISNKYMSVAESAYQIGAAFSTLDSKFGDIASVLLNVVGITAEAIGKLIGMATAKGVSNAFKLPWPQNLAAVATVVAAGASAAGQIAGLASRKYATGGIVSGPGTGISDSIPIRVSNGEMILNHRQQSNLFNLLDKGSCTEGKIEFKNKLVGSDIIGSATTYNKRRNLIL